MFFLFQKRHQSEHHREREDAQEEEEDVNMDAVAGASWKGDVIMAGLVERFLHGCRVGDLDVLRQVMQEVSQDAPYVAWHRRVPMEDLKNCLGEVIAAENGHLHVVMTLARVFSLTSADVKKNENLLLTTACAHGQINIVKYLVKTFDYRKEDFLRSNAFAALFREQQVEILEYIIPLYGILFEEAVAAISPLDYDSYKQSKPESVYDLLEVYANKNDRECSIKKKSRIQ